ncbi:hypothetical protein LCGC14_1668710 [marine sediment metagenome]|uniref:Uncharacterized protein n=1 Tax=marine sediment metagenome TaxID=412755 RepID=A0A0F9HRX9_9ZZZZ
MVHAETCPLCRGNGGNGIPAGTIETCRGCGGAGWVSVQDEVVTWPVYPSCWPVYPPLESPPFPLPGTLFHGIAYETVQ